MYWSLATACMRLGGQAHAVLMLEKAVAFGWRDAHWLDADSEFTALHKHTLFGSLRETLQSAEPVQLE